MVSSNPYAIVDKFEQALCDYTGAKFAVATTSCTMALLLSLCFFNRTKRGNRWILPTERITIPKRTYIGVAMSVCNAGYLVDFRDEEWVGGYRLQMLPVWDYARRFASGMYVPGTMQCLSFHWNKILGIGQGGAILHDNVEADDYLRRARFDGRRTDIPASEDNPKDLGYHAYMMPRDAAEGLTRLKLLPKNNADLPNDEYPDLSKMEVFR